jgi:hypothetical protein
MNSVLDLLIDIRTCQVAHARGLHGIPCPAIESVEATLVARLPRARLPGNEKDIPQNRKLWFLDVIKSSTSTLYSLFTKVWNALLLPRGTLYDRKFLVKNSR